MCEFPQRQADQRQETSEPQAYSLWQSKIPIYFQHFLPTQRVTCGDIGHLAAQNLRELPQNWCIFPICREKEFLVPTAGQVRTPQ
jgi:hypothetical protein